MCMVSENTGESVTIVRTHLRRGTLGGHCFGRNITHMTQRSVLDYLMSC